MPETQDLRKELEGHIHCLPAEELYNLLSYAKFLGRRHEHVGSKDDPIVSSFLKAYIGGVSKGNLAKDIDKELYG